MKIKIVRRSKTMASGNQKPVSGDTLSTPHETTTIGPIEAAGQEEFPDIDTTDSGEHPMKKPNTDDDYINGIPDVTEPANYKW